MKDPKIDQVLTQAVAAYELGQPVVVKDQEEQVLHGEELLKSIAGVEMPMQAFVVSGVPRDYFEASEWPEILEAARRVWFLKENPDRVA